ncbi:MAG: hypothetical protein JOZ39_00870, partial [Chloroflexi bacterium]|nr:hypothetical protein [Chloroflexota bacterium]
MALSASIGRRAAFFKERLPRRPDKLSWRAFLPAGLSLAAWPLLATSYVLGLLGLSLLLPMLLPASVADAPGAGDAVYSELILSMARGIHGVGLMLSVPLTDGAGWLAVVFAAGSSAVGALLLQLAVNLTLVVLTTAILVLSGGHFASSWVRALFASRWLRLGCGLTMAFAAAAQLRLPWQRGTGGDMALSMVATKLAGLNGSTYGSVVDGSPIAALGLNLTLVLLAAGAGFGFSSLLLAIVRKRSGWPLPVFRQAAPAMVVGLVLTLSPIQQPIAFERSGPPVETEVAVEVALPNTVEVDPPVTVPGASLPASATPAP